MNATLSSPPSPILVLVNFKLQLNPTEVKFDPNVFSSSLICTAIPSLEHTPPLLCPVSLMSALNLRSHVDHLMHEEIISHEFFYFLFSYHVTEV